MTQGLAALSENLGLNTSEFLKNVSLLVHGTTVPLNTLLQGNGTRVGLICTDGFRDTLEVRLGYREKRYDFHLPDSAAPRPPLSAVAGARARRSQR